MDFWQSKCSWFSTLDIACVDVWNIMFIVGMDGVLPLKSNSGPLKTLHFNFSGS